MRSSHSSLRAAGSLVALAALSLPAAFAVGCGGGTPPAKDGSDVASAGSASADEASSAPAAAASDSAAAPPPATGDTSGATNAQAPSATASGSGDIKPDGDDPWLAAHQMPAGDVMHTMHAANSKVQACWKAGLKRDPSIGGDVNIRFVVENGGKVRVWRDDGSSMTDGDVTQCVGDVVSKLKFPKQKSPGDAWGVFTIHLGP